MEISVGYANPELKTQAQQLSAELNLPMDNYAPVMLWFFEDKLGLKKEGFLPIYADFNWETWKKRHQEGRKQGLIRACKPNAGMKILDVSAGLGRDAAILASFGAEVCMLERNPIVHALLKHALSLQDSASQQRLKLTLYKTEAKDYLKKLKSENYPDVIYFDPMHPTRQKAALVKKDLQLLQELIGEDQDALDLLTVARMYVKQKVVVKWPQKLPPLLSTNMQIEGKVIRFDMFI